MKTPKGLKLVGLLLKHSFVTKTYSISHVYQRVASDKLCGIMLQLGYDVPCYQPFDKIAESMGDAYGPMIHKLWNCTTEHQETLYFQFDKASSPYLVLLSGWWTLVAQD